MSFYFNLEVNNFDLEFIIHPFSCVVMVITLH